MPDNEHIADEVQDQTLETAVAEGENASGEDPVALLREQLTASQAAREKAERDLSSLRGQVRSSRELEDRISGELSGIYKYLDVVARATTQPDASDDWSVELSNVKNEATTAARNRQFTETYAQLADDLRGVTSDEEGKPLFDSLESAPELESAREYWNIGKSGYNGATALSVSDRIASLTRAVAEAAKASRIAERQKQRTAEATAKQQREETRKKQRDESGELDLDGGDAAAGGTNVDALSPSDRLNQALKSDRAKGKRSVIFGG